MIATGQIELPIVHLAEIFKLADKARLLRDPELAMTRMNLVLALAGL